MVKRVALILLLIALTGCGGGGGGSALKPGSEEEVGTDPATIGSPEHFGLVGFNPQGEEPVHFRSARLVGVPDGMKVLGIRSVRLQDGNSTVRGWRGELTSGPGAKLEFHNVDDVVLDPRAPFEEYYLVVTVTATRAGEFHTKGLEVSWTAGKRKGETFFPYLVGLVTPGAGQS